MKVIYAILLVIIFLVGIASLFYGLFMIWKPLAYIAIGLFLCLLAAALNQAYEEGR